MKPLLFQGYLWSLIVAEFDFNSSDCSFSIHGLNSFKNVFYTEDGVIHGTSEESPYKRVEDMYSDYISYVNDLQLKNVAVHLKQDLNQ